MTGNRIVNYGVGGYGLDQAVLKFEKFGEPTHGHIAILAFGREEYRRCLAYHSFYYFENDWAAYAFKPMFMPTESGAYNLVKPPTEDADSLYHLLTEKSASLHCFLADHDYWFQKNAGKPSLRFPFSLALAKSLRAQWTPGNGSVGRDRMTTFFVNEESRELTRYLARRFCDHCKKADLEPLCLILYSPGDLAGLVRGAERQDQWLVDFFQHEKIPYLDFAGYMMSHGPAESDVKALAAPNGHYNAAGNSFIANALLDWWRSRQRREG
jgi:hypothetical protein